MEGHQAITARLSRLFIALCYFLIPRLTCQTPARVATKRTTQQRHEDYTFEGMLARAKEECSYMSLVNDTVLRNRTLQIIREKVGQKTTAEFYRRQERQKQRAKEYYERVEEQSRRKVLQGGGGRWDAGFVPPKPYLPPPPLFPRGRLHRRSAEGQGRRRKGSSPLSEVSFTDHNNCTSRCLFARMEMVDSYGFPEESLISKLIEDRIADRKVRLAKTKKVASCFKKMDEVVFDDSCIFSSKLFDCLDLDEQNS